MKNYHPAISALMLLAFATSAFAAPPAASVDPAKLVAEREQTELAHDQYGKIFEYYMEVCGVTRWMPKKGEAGGEFGHTVMHLKGACRDESVSYPKLKMCGPEGGEVSISMDSDYGNVQWTAVSDRKFMMYGNLAADAPLTDKEHEEAINEAVRQRIFRNVKLHAYHNALIKKGESYEHMVARWSIGTNFAVNFARSSYCTRIPLIPSKGPKNAMVKSLVDHFNALNRKALEDGFGYNGITNNCTHLAHNGLSSVGFWPAKDVGWQEPAGLGWLGSHVKENVSVPFNTMHDALMRGLGDENTFNPSRLSDAEAERKGFYKFRWIGAQPGVTMEVIPVHSYKNEKYATNTTPYLLDTSTELKNRLGMGDGKNEAQAMWARNIKDIRVLDLKANFKYWQKKYANDSRTSFPASSGWGGNSYPDLAPALSSYLRSQQADLANRMKLLDQVLAAPAEAAPDASPAAASAR
ncbi:MAG: hypothetical protein AB7K68_02900 [Bacteriovoracia bacterium]